MENKQVITKKRRHNKILTKIEDCFYEHKKNNIRVLSIEEIRGWMLDNYRNGISKRRLSTFLYRKKEFTLQKKLRWKNSNHFDTWWSLSSEQVKEADVNEEPNPNWINIPISEKTA